MAAVTKVRKGLITHNYRRRAAGGGCYESEDRVNNSQLREEQQVAAVMKVRKG